MATVGRGWPLLICVGDVCSGLAIVGPGWFGALVVRGW